MASIKFSVDNIASDNTKTVKHNNFSKFYPFVVGFELFLT
jgi:hypothetical protein